MKKKAIYQLKTGFKQDFDIRKELLLFDKIYIPEELVEESLKSSFKSQRERMLAEIEFLIDERQIEIINTTKTLNNAYKKIEEKIKNMTEEQINRHSKKMEYLDSMVNFLNEYPETLPKLSKEVHKEISHYRKYIENNKEVKSKPSSLLNFAKYIWLKSKYKDTEIEYLSTLLEFAEENNSVIPILNSSQSFMYEIFKKQQNKLKKDESIGSEKTNLILYQNKTKDVANILLKQIPTPIKGTPLEEIVNFKSDSENIRKLRDLDRWINKICKSEVSQKEIEQEIDYLLNEYERILQLNKIKYKYSNTEIILNTTLGTLEKLITIQWSKIGNSLFEFKKAKADFLLAESQIIGRELAYIHETKKLFNE